MKKLFAATLALSLPLVAMAQAAPAAEAPKPAPITVTPYGIISLGAYSNSGVFAAQDYPAYAVSKEEGATVLSARQSRFGVNVGVPTENVLGATVNGKIEFDFMAPGSFTSAPMRLRHAFMTAAIAAGPGKLVITAGQTDGLLNALHPESTSYLALPLFQQAGNIHRRTGQLRLGYDFAADAFAVKVEAAVLNPTYGKSDFGTAAVNDDAAFNAGNRSGMPDVEARLGATLKPISGFGGTVGVSILSGKRTYGAALGTTTDVSTSAFGVDFVADLTEFASVRGEFFSGKGFDDAYAGIASASVAGTDGVKSTGYWAQAIIKPIPVIYVLVGMGSEKVDEATYAAALAPQRMQNDMIHGGLLLNMNKAWRVGLEYVGTTTKSRATNTAASVDTKASQMSLSTQLRF
jgi:hypothetical protein